MKKYVAILLCAALLFSGCTFRGRIIAEEPQAPSAANAASPDIISPEDGADAQAYTYNASLYFPYSEDNLLGREERKIIYSANERLENAVLSALLLGPGDDYEELNPIVNGDVRVINTSMNGNCLFITFNAAFLEPVNELPEDWEENAELLSTVRQQRRMAILSIVNTVTQLSGIRQVQILVDTEGDGLGRRIKRQDMGLTLTGGNQDELLEIISRQYSANASLQTVSALVFRLMQDKNYGRLYTYIADHHTDEKPAYADWVDTFRGVEWTLESFEVPETLISADGQTAQVFVNAKFNLPMGNTVEHSGVPMDFVCESGVWKVDYASLSAILPRS